MTILETIALSVLVYLAGVFIMAQLIGQRLKRGEITSGTAVVLGYGVPLIIAICVGVLL